MAKKQNIELHNEEVKEIMKEIPGTLIHWGLTIIFLIFAFIIAGSYFFRFKEIVSAPLVITTSVPPAPIISNTSGRIMNWFVKDGQVVKKGEHVALIENSTSLKDFFHAEKIIDQLDSSKIDSDSNLVLPKELRLGDLQISYNKLYNSIESYRNYCTQSYLPQKMELLKKQMQKQNQHYELSLLQQKMINQERDIIKKGLERNQALHDKGGSSKVEIEERKARVIQSDRQYTNFIASLKSEEINMLNQKRSLLDLEEQHQKNIDQFRTAISVNIQSLKDDFNVWKSKYLLPSPIEGRVTLTNFWSENQVVIAGEILATIVPDNQSSVICKAVVPSSGIGKIEPEQKVQIKLNGYPYMEHGMLTGKVNRISLVPGKDGYFVEIGLSQGMVSSYSEQLKLVQEMDGVAEIITKETRLIYRIINPLKMLLNK